MTDIWLVVKILLFIIVASFLFFVVAGTLGIFGPQLSIGTVNT